MQLEPLFLCAAAANAVGVKGQLSQKPQRILLGEDPWDFSLGLRHHGQVSQVCPAAAPGHEYICVFIWWCGTTSRRIPDHFPSQHLMLMFKWAYWISPSPFSGCWTRLQSFIKNLPAAYSNGGHTRRDKPDFAHLHVVQWRQSADWESTQPELNCVCSIHSGKKSY